MSRYCCTDNSVKIYLYDFAGSIVRILQTTRSESIDVAVDFAEIQLVATTPDNMLIETQDPDIAMRNLELTGFIRQQYLKPFISYDRLHQKYGVEFATSDNCQICDKKFRALIRPMQNCRFCGRAVCSACRSWSHPRKTFILILHISYKFCYLCINHTKAYTHMQPNASCKQTFNKSQAAMRQYVVMWQSDCS